MTNPQDPRLETVDRLLELGVILEVDLGHAREAGITGKHNIELIEKAKQDAMKILSAHDFQIDRAARLNERSKIIGWMKKAYPVQGTNMANAIKEEMEADELEAKK